MNLREIASEPISRVRRRDVICVAASTPLLSVIEKMTENTRGAAAAVDEEGLLVGIFTVRDLTRRIDHANQSWHTRPVSEAMTKSPTCITETDSIATALRLMKEGGFRHLPRVDAAGRPTSILSVRDIVVYVSERFPKEFLNLPPDPSNIATKPYGG